MSEAWAVATVEKVVRSFKRCVIANALDGFKDGELHDCLSDIGAVAYSSKILSIADELPLDGPNRSLRMALVHILLPTSAHHYHDYIYVP